MEMKGIPYLTTNIEKEARDINREIGEHFANRPKVKIEEWERKFDELRKKRSAIPLKNDESALTPEQLELLGINFDPYDNSRYVGGEAYLIIGKDRVQLSTLFEKINGEDRR
jgi:hypothetical protein